MVAGGNVSQLNILKYVRVDCSPAVLFFLIPKWQCILEPTGVLVERDASSQRGYAGLDWAGSATKFLWNMWDHLVGVPVPQQLSRLKPAGFLT